MSTLYVRNLVQKVLFIDLKKQITDGFWFTAVPANDWECWTAVEIVVADKVGRDFSIIKDNYDFTNPAFLDIAGNKLFLGARLAALYPKTVKRVLASEYGKIPMSYNTCKGILAELNKADIYNPQEEYVFKIAEAWRAAWLTANMVRDAENYTAYTTANMLEDLEDLKAIIKIAL